MLHTKICGRFIVFLLLQELNKQFYAVCISHFIRYEQLSFFRLRIYKVEAE